MRDGQVRAAGELFTDDLLDELVRLVIETRRCWDREQVNARSTRRKSPSHDLLASSMMMIFELLTRARARPMSCL